MAKKLLLSLGVISVFIAYSWQQRHQISATVATNNSNSNQSQGSNTAAPHPVGDDNSSTHKMPSSSNGKYKDGQYTGNVADAFYGNLQVKAIISGGKITDVQFLQYPNDQQNSVFVNQQAMPVLKQEAIKAQSSHVDIVSGATESSVAFVQSLTNALDQAV